MKIQQFRGLKPSSSCLHFLEAANDNPMTPAPAYKSATDAPYGTYFCSFRSKILKAWKEEIREVIRILSGNLRLVLPIKIFQFSDKDDPQLIYKQCNSPKSQIIDYIHPLRAIKITKSHWIGSSPVCLPGQNWKEPRTHQFHQHVPKNLFLQEDVSTYFQKWSAPPIKHLKGMNPMKKMIIHVGHQTRYSV